MKAGAGEGSRASPPICAAPGVQTCPDAAEPFNLGHPLSGDRDDSGTCPPWMLCWENRGFPDSPVHIFLTHGGHLARE